LASDTELAEFLKNAEKKAFKRAYYHVRDEEGALDIVQDSMIKLCSSYADKPVTELPLLFQRILSNTVLDWFRRQKTRKALFTNMNEFDSDESDSGFDCWKWPLVLRTTWPHKVPKVGWAECRPSNTLNQRSWRCPHVNEKPSCCVIGRSWMLQKLPP